MVRTTIVAVSCDNDVALIETGMSCWRREPSMLWWTRIWLLFWCGILVFLGGCSSTPEQRLDPEYDIGTAQLLVIPFQHRPNSSSVLRWHYESPTGVALARAIRLQIPSECGAVNVVQDQHIADRVFHTDDDQVPWGEIGTEARASHVLTGRIERLTFRDPRSPGLLQGRMQGYWELFLVPAGRPILRREFDIRVPEGPESGRIFISFESSEKELEGAMLGKLALQISSILCGEEAP